MILDLTPYGLSNIILSLQVTPLANFFAILISFASLLLLFLVKEYKLPKRFYTFFTILIGSLYIIVYASDFLVFFIGWEIMSISTYFLLSFTLSKEILIKYILFAITSALTLFIALLILYSTQQTLLYENAHQSFLLLDNFSSYLFITFMLTAIFIKVGIIGFHYWLIDSYEKSHNIFTPFLSAVVSKMGIYALIILVTQVIDITYVLAIIGVLTSIIATFKAMQEDSLKRLLAYSSIAQIGYIITVLGVYDGIGGAMYHSLIHTLTKLLLFINIAGIIVVTQKDSFSELGGLISKMPQSFFLMLIGIISLAGMPPLGGFSSKFLIYTSLLDAKYLLILSAVMFSSASAFLYIYKLIYGIYLGHPTHQKLESVQEVSIYFLIPQYILAALLILLGVFPALIVPYFNVILNDLSLNTISFSSYATLQTLNGSFNGSVIMIAFIAIFIIIFTFFQMLKSKTYKK